MNLNLKYAPTPENAPLFAADIVGATKRISGVEMDYTPASLRLVDEIIESFRTGGVPADKVGETLFGFGCYVGEVFVRHAACKWYLQDGGILAVKLDERGYCNPIEKTFKRMVNGESDSVAYFYQVFTSQASSRG